MFTVSKRFHFSASHALTHLPKTHPCYRLHGHNYEVEVELAAHDLDDNGFVLDYRLMEWFEEHLLQAYDHRHLNDVVPATMATTAENLARSFWWLWNRRLENQVRVHVRAVRVKETGKTQAEYSVAVPR